MEPKKLIQNSALVFTIMSFFAMAQIAPAQNQPATNSTVSETRSSDAVAASFNEVADKALQAMKQRAEELNIKGVALVAYSQGDTVQAWSSKMVVVGHLSTPPSNNDSKGSNLLGIAYTKAAEMADTLRDSGSHVRLPKTGEYGWQGGAVTKGKTGILIAAFSGGASADDLKVSKTGLAILADKL